VSGVFEVKVDLKQGSALSPMWFMAVVQKDLVRKSYSGSNCTQTI